MVKSYREEALNILKKWNWKICVNNLMNVEEDDCTFWYEYGSSEPILLVTKGDIEISLFTSGDIDIWKSDTEYFMFEEGNGEDGKLTEDLILCGHWEANNWFEILVTRNREIIDSGIVIDSGDIVNCSEEGDGEDNMLGCNNLFDYIIRHKIKIKTRKESFVFR